MATAQQPSVFSAEEAQRFAALMAGFETGNPSEAEAMGKGKLLRRMAAEKNIRLVDALELHEIAAAIDAQLQPVRMAIPDVAALQAENDDLRGKLAVAVPKVTELAEALEAERTLSDQWEAAMKSEKETTVFAVILFAVEILVAIIAMCIFGEKGVIDCGIASCIAAVVIWLKGD
jgi:hypothetical protein